MKALCPQHKIELEVESKTIMVLGKSHSVAVGKCPKCRIQYINRNFFPLCATFEIDHQGYQFLNGLHAPFKKVQIIPDTTLEVKDPQHTPKQTPAPVPKNNKINTQSTISKKDESSRKKKPVPPPVKSPKVTSAKQKKVEQKKAAKYFDTAPNYALKSLTNSTKKPSANAARVAESARQGAALRKASAESANRPAADHNTKTTVAKIPIIWKASYPSEVTTVELYSETGTMHTITIVENPAYANSLRGVFQRDCSISRDILKHIKDNKPNITFMSQPCVITGYTNTNAMKAYLGVNASKNAAVQHTSPSRKAKAVTANPSRLIKSEITTVTVLSRSQQSHIITIVSDPSYQNSAQNILWKNRTLSRRILEGIKNNQYEIVFEGETCSIIEYTVTDVLEAYLKETRPSLDSELFVTIWMYKGKVPCPEHPDEVEAVTALIPSSHDFSEHPLNVNYCRRCRKYYINSIQFNLYAQRHGMPLINLRSMGSSGTYADYSTWQDESLLHFLGYNVNASDNIPEYARQELLAQAMDAGIVTKPNVCSFLEGLIRRSEGQIKMQAAIGKWKRDLQFVANYKIHDQRKVFGNLKIHR